jgi:hypothetical protein
MGIYSVDCPGDLDIEQAVKRAKWLRKNPAGVFYNYWLVYNGLKFPHGSIVTDIDLNTGNCAVSCRCCKREYGKFPAQWLAPVLDTVHAKKQKVAT